MFPIFHAHGHHDLGLYAALLGEARYFQIAGLVEWLERERYFQAVKVQRVAEEIEGTADLHGLTRSNELVEYYPFQTKRKVYVCPRGLYVHRGKPNACGRLCEREREDDKDDYEDEDSFHTLVVRKTVVVDHKLCFEG